MHGAERLLEGLDVDHHALVEEVAQRIRCAGGCISEFKVYGESLTKNIGCFHVDAHQKNDVGPLPSTKFLRTG